MVVRREGRTRTRMRTRTRENWENGSAEPGERKVPAMWRVMCSLPLSAPGDGGGRGEGAHSMRAWELRGCRPGIVVRRRGKTTMLCMRIILTGG